jgi:hypothetical protein
LVKKKNNIKPTLLYLSNAVFPSRTAHSVQIINMCDGFLNFSNKVILFGRAFKGKTSHDISIFYNSRNGINFSLVNNSSPILAYFKYVFSFIKLKLRKEKINFIFSRSLVLMIIARLFYNSKIVYEIHSPNEGAQKILEKICIKLSLINGVVFISKSLKNFYLNRYPTLRNFCVLHDGAKINSELKNFNIINKKTFKCGYLGSSHVGKGARTVINLSFEMLDIDFHLCGIEIVFLSRTILPRRNKIIYFYTHGFHIP